MPGTTVPGTTVPGTTVPGAPLVPRPSPGPVVVRVVAGALLEAGGARLMIVVADPR